MITLDNISSLHAKYNSLAADADLCLDRNLNDLMMFALDSEHMDFDGDKLTLAQGGALIPAIEIERIKGAEDLGSHMAIVLPTSLVLVNKANGRVQVYLPEEL